MFRLFETRPGHYLLLSLAAALLFLPNLGLPSLWDIDEGHNAEAAREMMASGNWIVPTFNFQLRVDKPALLYWLQIAAYETFGINEFAARLPSALAALLAVLICYELGRCLFGAREGFYAGIILASSVLFCASAHFANPDALLNATTLLTCFCLWQALAEGRPAWFLASGISSGLAVLAKGPVGLVLPGAIAFVFLTWTYGWRRLRSWYLGGGILTFIFTALPWYVWVGVDTRTDFLRGFFFTHNVGRFLQPMESHGGPVFYYLLVLLVGLAPWSIFLGLTSWQTWTTLRRPDSERTYRATQFLVSWIGVYLIFFSLSRTKLPNYVLPIYPPLALLTARFLETWRQRATRANLSSPWLERACVASLASVGVITILGLLWASGILEIPGVRGRRFPGLERWAFLGLWPLLGALIGGWLLRQRRQDAVLKVLSVCAVLYTGTLAAWGGSALEAYKAPRLLTQAFDEDHAYREVRVGCYQYYQPSLVFYAQREVIRLEDEAKLLEFFTYPAQVYVFLPASVWPELEAKIPGTRRVLARQHDMYRGYEVLLVTNQEAR